jgi:ABC-2 type transport system ATP-binding protein
MASPPVRVEGLQKTYPSGVEALKGVSFDVADGEIFGLLGPNGAGKTTAIGVLTTLVRPTAGRALVAGYDVTVDRLAVRRAIGVVF